MDLILVFYLSKRNANLNGVQEIWRYVFPRIQQTNGGSGFVPIVTTRWRCSEYGWQS